MPSHVDDQVAEWRRWIDGRIRHEVLGMHRYRFIYREVKEMLGANPAVSQLPSEFWNFHQFNYAAAKHSRCDAKPTAIRGPARSGC